MSEDEKAPEEVIRWAALIAAALTHGEGSPDEIIARAKAFEAYIRGPE